MSRTLVGAANRSLWRHSTASLLYPYSTPCTLPSLYFVYLTGITAHHLSIFCHAHVHQYTFQRDFRLTHDDCAFLCHAFPLVSQTNHFVRLRTRPPIKRLMKITLEIGQLGYFWCLYNICLSSYKRDGRLFYREQESFHQKKNASTSSQDKKYRRVGRRQFTVQEHGLCWRRESDPRL